MQSHTFDRRSRCDYNPYTNTYVKQPNLLKEALIQSSPPSMTMLALSNKVYKLQAKTEDSRYSEKNWLLTARWFELTRHPRNSANQSDNTKSKLPRRISKPFHGSYFISTHISIRKHLLRQNAFGYPIRYILCNAI